MRVAAPIPFTVESVEAIRSDVLTLMRNVTRIRDGADPNYDKLRSAVRAWRSGFFDRMYKDLDLTGAIRFRLTGSDRAPTTDEANQRERSWYDSWKKRIGEETWPLYLALGEFPFQADWSASSTKWADRVRRAAKRTVRVLTDLLGWLDGAPLTEDVRVVDDARIEGMAVQMVGFEDDEHDNEAVGALRAGLRNYVRNARRWCPALLAAPLPIQYRFDCRIGLGGRYETSHVVLCAQTEPSLLTQYLAHEMGHHVFKTQLSDRAVEYWSTACHRDLRDLDLREVRSVWARHPDLDVYELIESLKGPDPTLSLQLAGVVYGYSQHAGRPSWTTLEALDATLADPKARQTLTVPAHPVTAYGTKNAEETFCEVLGLLIGYGPRTVDPYVRALFDTCTGDLVRSASLRTLTEGVHEFDVQAGPFAATVSVLVPVETGRVPTIVMEVEARYLAMESFADYEDELLRNASTELGVPLTWSEGAWGRSGHPDTAARYVQERSRKKRGHLDSSVIDSFLVRHAGLLERLAARPMKEPALLALMAKMRKRQGTFRGAELKQVLEYLGWTVSEKVAWRPDWDYNGTKTQSYSTQTSRQDAEAARADYLARQVDELPDPTTLPRNTRVYQDVGPVTEWQDWNGNPRYGFEYVGWHVTTDVVLTGPDGSTWTGPVSLADWLTQYPNGPCLKWLYGSTPFLQQVSDRLGLPTHDAEKAEKARIRSIPTRDNTGTCPVCFRVQKLTPGSLHGTDRSRPGMVLHGYQRPGLGYVVGNCFGQGWPPWELSSEGTVAWVGRLHDQLHSIEVSIANLEAGKVEVIMNREKLVKKQDVTEAEWKRIVDARHAELKSWLSGTEKTIEDLDKKIRGWVLGTLPGTMKKAKLHLSLNRHADHQDGNCPYCGSERASETGRFDSTLVDPHECRHDFECDACEGLFSVTYTPVSAERVEDPPVYEAALDTRVSGTHIVAMEVRVTFRDESARAAFEAAWTKRAGKPVDAIVDGVEYAGDNADRALDIANEIPGAVVDLVH